MFVNQLLLLLELVVGVQIVGETTCLLESVVCATCSICRNGYLPGVLPQSVVSGATHREVNLSYQLYIITMVTQKDYLTGNANPGSTSVSNQLIATMAISATTQNYQSAS